jgi:hypothetical protein
MASLGSQLIRVIGDDPATFSGMLTFHLGVIWVHISSPVGCFSVFEILYVSIEWLAGKNKNLVPLLNGVPRHEDVWEVEVYLHAFLTSELDGREWLASRLGRFIPDKRTHRYPLVMRLGGPQSRSGRGGEDKNPCPPSGELNLGRPDRHAVTILTELSDWRTRVYPKVSGLSR